MSHMRFYTESTPLIFRNDSSKHRVASGFRGSWFLTMRRCPKCAGAMVSNGQGHFWCNACSYHDEKDVSKYKSLRGKWYHGKRKAQWCDEY